LRLDGVNGKLSRVLSKIKKCTLRKSKPKRTIVIDMYFWTIVTLGIDISWVVIEVANTVSVSLNCAWSHTVAYSVPDSVLM